MYPVVVTIGARYDGPLGDGMAHQLRRASQAVNASWQLRSSDLTPPQFAVLQVLDEGESLDQKTLGALAAVDRSTLTLSSTGSWPVASSPRPLIPTTAVDN